MVVNEVLAVWGGLLGTSGNFSIHATLMAQTRKVIVPQCVGDQGYVLSAHTHWSPLALNPLGSATGIAAK